MVIVMPLQDKIIEFILHKKERRIEDNSMTLETSIFLKRNYISLCYYCRQRGLVEEWKKRKR